MLVKGATGGTVDVWLHTVNLWLRLTENWQIALLDESGKWKHCILIPTVDRWLPVEVHGRSNSCWAPRLLPLNLSLTADTWPYCGCHNCSLYTYTKGFVYIRCYVSERYPNIHTWFNPSSEIESSMPDRQIFVSSMNLFCWIFVRETVCTNSNTIANLEVPFPFFCVSCIFTLNGSIDLWVYRVIKQGSTFHPYLQLDLCSDHSPDYCLRWRSWPLTLRIAVETGKLARSSDYIIP